jgi:HK97 family phage major capsid protein
LVSCFTGATESAARDDGVWIMSKNGYAAALSLADTTGQPIVHFGTATQDAPAGTILGRPIIVSARVTGSLTLDNTTAATQKTNILFGPLSTFIAGTRLGMSWDVTDQVSWSNYRADVRLIGRFGGRIGVPAAWTYSTVLY